MSPNPQPFMAARVPSATSQPCPRSPRTGGDNPVPHGGHSTPRTGRDRPSGAVALPMEEHPGGSAVGLGGARPDPEPPGAAERRRKPGPGEEVAQVPAVTCAAPGVPLPAPRFDVISGRASPGPPPPDTPGPRRSRQIWQREEEPLAAPGANGRGLLRQWLPGRARVGHTHTHVCTLAPACLHMGTHACTRVCAEGHPPAAVHRDTRANSHTAGVPWGPRPPLSPARGVPTSAPSPGFGGPRGNWGSSGGCGVGGLG